MGALVDAFIGISLARVEAIKEAGQEAPKWVRIRALIDTGASITCVDPFILKDTLKLTPTGNTSIVSPTTGNQPVNVDQYDVGLFIPPAGEKETWLTIGNLPVVCSELLITAGFHVLIGRDVLAQCLFSYNGSSGSFTLAY
jgi:hypothetical protein